MAAVKFTINRSRICIDHTKAQNQAYNHIKKYGLLKYALFEYSTKNSQYYKFTEKPELISIQLLVPVIKILTHFSLKCSGFGHLT
jgi:hypothetical protein